MAVYTKRGVDVFAPQDAGGAARGVDNGDAQIWSTEIEHNIEAAAEGYIVAATWVGGLAEVVGTRGGQPARVPTSDTGTHTDPVVGGTVPNSGEFAWSDSPAGWRRIADVIDTVTLNASIASLEEVNDLSVQQVDIDVTAGTVTLTPTQGLYGALRLVGSPAGTRYVNVPANWSGRVTNAISTSNRVNIKTASESTGITVPGGATLTVYTESGVTYNGEISLIRSRAIVDGRVIALELSGGTAIITTTQGRVWDEAMSGVPTARIAAVTDAVVAAQQALIIDLDGTPDGNGFLTPVVVSLTSLAQAGWQTGNKRVLWSLSTASASATTEQDMIYGGGDYQLDLKRDPDLLTITQTPGVVKVFQKGANAQSNRYTRWAMIHQVNAGNRCDVWHVEGIWDSRLIGYNESRLQEIGRTSGSEYETAIKVVGAADFVGGRTHGYQELFDIAMFADGVERPIDTTADFRCRVLDVFQASTMYLHGTTTPLCTAYTHWRWTRDGLELEVTYQFAAVVTLENTYAGMLAVHRTRGSGSTSAGAAIDVVTKGRRSPEYTEEDLSTDSYPSVFTQAETLRGYGAGGYHFEQIRLSGWDKPNRRARFAPEVFNKFYQDLLGNGYVTAVDEVISSKVLMRVHNPN